MWGDLRKFKIVRRTSSVNIERNMWRENLLFALINAFVCGINVKLVVERTNNYLKLVLTT